jgi:phosphocarrier protein
MMDQDDWNYCTETAAPIEGALSRTFEIVNRKGLHARATAKFVQCAEAFEADIRVTRCGETVGGTSIMGILTLGAGIGTTITVTASAGFQCERSSPGSVARSRHTSGASASNTTDQRSQPRVSGGTSSNSRLATTELLPHSAEVSVNAR